MYQGDYLAASTVVFNFNTAAFSDGSPITLGGTPALSVYKNSTIESTAGITLTVDYDARTGMHHVVIDTSADGTFYAAGNDFDVIITTGTVGGTSVVGRKVGSFSLENRTQKADVRKVLGTAVTAATAGILDVNAKNINNVSTSSVTTINANQGTTQPVNFDGTGATAYVKSDVEHWVTVAPNALAQGKVDATDNARNGTAQAGAAGTITLDSGASATDQFYRGMKISIVSGTGSGQGSRLIGGYTGSTKVASVVPNWTVTPDSTSVFIISTWCGTDVELWELVTPNSLISGRVDVSIGANNAGNLTSNVIQWNSTNVASPATAGIPEVNIKNVNNVSASSVTTVNANQGTTQPINFSGTGGTAYVKSDIEQIVAVAPTLDANNVLNVSTKYVGGTLQTAGDIPGRLPSALSANGNMKSDIEEIAGNTGGASRLDRSSRAIGIGTVGTGSTTASIVTSSLSPVAATTDQFKGRIVIFDKDTTTANLRGQATDITGSSSGGVLTVTALTTAPVSGDSFTIT